MQSLSLDSEAHRACVPFWGISLTTVGEIEAICERVVPTYHFQLQKAHIYTLVHTHMETCIPAYSHFSLLSYLIYLFIASFLDIINTS